jgi:hypothetical protein
VLEGKRWAWPGHGKREHELGGTRAQCPIPPTHTRMCAPWGHVSRVDCAEVTRFVLFCSVLVQDVGMGRWCVHRTSLFRCTCCESTVTPNKNFRGAVQPRIWSTLDVVDRE